MSPQEKVRRNEARASLLASLVEHATQPFASAYADGRIDIVNAAFCELVGYTKDELKSISWLTELTPIEFWTMEAERLAELHRTGRPIYYEKEYVRKDGARVPVGLLVHLVRDDPGEPGFYFAYITVLTERNLAEKALWEGEERFRQVFENMGSSIVVYEAADDGEDFVVRELNPAAERALKTHRAAVAGLKVADAFPDVEHFGLMEVFRRVWKTGVPERKPEGLYQDQRLTLWADNYVFKLPSGEIAAIFEDVTERRQAEEALRGSERRYRELVETMREGVWAVDQDFMTTFVNARMAEMLGFAPEAIVGRHIFDFIPPDALETAAKQAEKRMRGLAEDFDVGLRRADGSVLWAGLETRAIIDETGTFRGAVAAVQDLSERKAAEAALRERDEQLRQPQKMEAIGQLAGGIAHDFNNLLTAIIGYSDLVLEQPADTPIALVWQDVHAIKHAAEHASALTRQILAFSRRQALRPQLVSLGDVIRETEPLLRRTLGENVDLVTKLDPALGLTEVDPAQLMQVLMNLALNARDAMPSGGRLTIEAANACLDEAYREAHPGAQPGECVVLAVSDNGQGMSKEILARIFEPFFTTKGPGLGTGLGLSTVYGIVKQSGGNIFVCSEPDVGTTFKIYLPRAGGSGPALLVQ